MNRFATVRRSFMIRMLSCSSALISMQADSLNGSSQSHTQISTFLLALKMFHSWYYLCSIGRKLSIYSFDGKWSRIQFFHLRFFPHRKRMGDSQWQQVCFVSRHSFQRSEQCGHTHKQTILFAKLFSAKKENEDIRHRSLSRWSIAFWSHVFSWIRPRFGCSFWLVLMWTLMK